MLEIVPDLLEGMKDNASESAPDILAAFSQVLMDIFSEFLDAELPEYIRLLTLMVGAFSKEMSREVPPGQLGNLPETSQQMSEVRPEFPLHLKCKVKGRDCDLVTVKSTDALPPKIK
jgi:hypothetical protein